MKILIIDCLFVPSLKGKIAGGVQIFTRNQMELLDSLGETYYITAAGSDKIYENQFILNNIFSSIDSTRQEKIKVTRGANKDSSERSPNGLSSQDAKSTKAANKSF